MKITKITSVAWERTSYNARPVAYALLLLFVIPVFPQSRVLAQTKDAPNILREISNATARVVKQAKPAVVGIWVDINMEAEQAYYQGARGEVGMGQHTFVSQSTPNQPLDDSQPQSTLPGLFPQMQGHKQALGSGFIASPDGYIITNDHVVGKADLVLVTIGDDDPVRAEVIGTDPLTDLAVIHVKGRNDLPVLALGDSDKLEVGDWVIAVGQPFGLSHTVTSGIVSALGRSQMDLTAYEDFIQTDAAINPGNSGGPLVNLAGKVVGVNTAILGPQGNIGIGFAIPINMVKEVYEQIRKNGKVVRGFLGVSIQDLTPDLIAAFGLPKNTKGVLISNVAKNSPAEAAGLMQGDVMVQLEGKPIVSPGPFQTQVSMLQPGTQVPVVVLRNGSKTDFTIKLGSRIKSTSATSSRRATLEVAGMAVTKLDQALAQRLGYEDVTGVIVVAVAPDSIAEFSGLAPGIRIDEVDHQPVSGLRDFENTLKTAAQKPPVLLLVDHQGVYRYIVLAGPHP